MHLLIRWIAIFYLKQKQKQTVNISTGYIQVSIVRNGSEEDRKTSQS